MCSQNENESGSDRTQTSTLSIAFVKSPLNAVRKSTSKIFFESARLPMPGAVLTRDYRGRRIAPRSAKTVSSMTARSTDRSAPPPRR